MDKLLNKIKKIGPEQIDALWAILKYKEMGILRKLKSMCVVVGLNFQDIDNDLLKDEEGRILDKATRHKIHDVLIEVS